MELNFVSPILQCVRVYSIGVRIEKYNIETFIRLGRLLTGFLFNSTLPSEGPILVKRSMNFYVYPKCRNMFPVSQPERPNTNLNKDKNKFAFHFTRVPSGPIK